MLISILLALVIVFVVAIDFVAMCLLLGVGLRWAKAREWTCWRVVVTTLLLFVAAAVMNVLGFWLLDDPNLARQWDMTIMIALGHWAVCIGIIARSFRLSFPRAIQAWLTTWLSMLVMAVLLFVLVRPFVFESFVCPTNSMAPTLLGTHGRDTCDTCGGTCYFSPPPVSLRSVGPLPMICDKLHVHQKLPQSLEAYPGSRSLTAKFLKPRRWDLMVFKYPANPQEYYVKRVVGLPGETVVIENGKLKIDGEVVEVPEHLQGIEYLTEIPLGYRTIPISAGSAENPAELADDEYFVLGDFSIAAYDSRLWEQGAEGHPPYAVPRSHVRGVVSHILWPPERFRVLR